MTKTRPLVKLCAVALAVITLGIAATAASAKAPLENFYWRDSYGRGVGTPMTPDCGSGRQYDAGLCYDDCRSGYHGVGPVCWLNGGQKSYGRGAGTGLVADCRGGELDAGLCYSRCPSGYHGVGPVCWKGWLSRGRGVGHSPHYDCGGKQYDAGLCYDSCASGYHGVGPVCWGNQVASYGRGAGTVPQYYCGNKEQDAGLCYTPCRPGYHGVGPVCWGDTRKGYVDCGAGMAVSQKQCAMITGGQVVAVAMLANAEEREARKAKEMADAGPEGVKAAEQAADDAAPLMDRLSPIFDKIAQKSVTVSDGLKQAGEEVTEYLSENGPKLKKDLKFAMKFLAKAGKGTHSAVLDGEGIAAGRDAAPDWLRTITTVTGIVDPSGISGVISAFSYPVYDPPPQMGAHERVDWPSWTYIFGVSGNGDFRYYRLDGPGGWGASKVIGSGWGGMKFVTAGSHGDIFTVDRGDGNLYYYRLDRNMNWAIEHKKIGEGWGGMRKVFAGGTMSNGERVIYALEQNGQLLAYRYGAGDDPASLGSKVIGWGWTPDHTRQVFAGSRGVVYAIMPGDLLLRFPYGNYSSTPSHYTVGGGWGGVRQVFGGPNGSVFAVKDGNLLFFRDPGDNDYLIGPKAIGSGWGFAQVTAMKGW
jgi:hypothetical protein